jgi:Zn-dependent peptidase ImmA (M78 family)
VIHLDLMALADLTRPKEIATEIVRQTPQKTVAATPLDKIAQAAGIKEIQEKELNNLEGALVANPTKSEGIIILSRGARYHRKRFTLGHELGHFLIPRHGHQMECNARDMLAGSKNSQSPELRIEAEANAFSAELLMPESRFCSIGSFKQGPSLNSISELAQIFDVSFQASANRFISLHDCPCAMVFSYKGKILYGYNGANNPLWLNARKNDAIPFNSHTVSVNSNVENQISSDEIDASVWFGEMSGFNRPESLIEETLVQENGYVATLLWFEEEIEEVE